MCKGFTDERGNHFLLHAKVLGEICVTGKNLDFSSSLLRKLRSSTAKYLLGESRGSRGVYPLEEVGGLRGCSSDIISVQGMPGAVLGLSSCCLGGAGSSIPESSLLLVPTEPLGGQKPRGIFYFSLCFKGHVLYCEFLCVTCFSAMPSTAPSFSFSC